MVIESVIAPYWKAGWNHTRLYCVAIINGKPTLVFHRLLECTPATHFEYEYVRDKARRMLCDWNGPQWKYEIEERMRYSLLTVENIKDCGSACYNWPWTRRIRHENSQEEWLDLVADQISAESGQD